MGTGSDVLAPVNHYPIELKSDHDAVVAGLAWVDRRSVRHDGGRRTTPPVTGRRSGPR